jgi:CBS domain-containing protein
MRYFIYVKLKDILKHKGSRVWSVNTHQTVRDAVEILAAQRIGALLVMDDNNAIVGIFSERDIARALNQKGKDLILTPVRELMTSNVITASPDDDIKFIMGVMTQHRVRHIPVVREGKLEGLVSIGDVVKELLEESENQIRSLKEYMFGESPTDEKEAG